MFLPNEINCKICSYITDPDDIDKLWSLGIQYRFLIRSSITHLYGESIITGKFLLKVPHLQESSVPIDIDNIQDMYYIISHKHLK